ncbi:hypothetical protein D3C83_180270 [compost metagenome]
MLTDPSVSVVLGGFSGMSQLEEAVSASRAGPLDADVVARIERTWHNNFEL